MKNVTILTGEPTIEVIAEMELDGEGVARMGKWVEQHRPECMPDDWGSNPWKLFPHTEMFSGDENAHIRGPGVRAVSGNELLVELAGRKCYDSFGLKAGCKSNAEYIANTQAGDPTREHPLSRFFFAGISRRVSHEIIRNYVGADRDEEGAPSQESTRFTHHYGFFICPPRYLGKTNRKKVLQDHFETAMQNAYNAYLNIVEKECSDYEDSHDKPATGIEKKRIYEAASSFLPHQAETSFVWTTNPAAIAKFCRERDNEAADLEIQRFAKKWKRICVERWANLFPQPWMRNA